MSIFSPPRYQAPFKPMRKKEEDTLSIKVFTAAEGLIKGALFSCRMCGNCILQETAFICPMTCPKGLRNGLCGGATPYACEVDPSRPCTWYKIYERAEKLGRDDKLLEINAPLDGDRVGRETWLDVVRTWRETEDSPKIRDFFFNRETFDQDWEHVFYKIRQPDWWGGDSQYHPPAYDDPISLLEANLETGEFTSTAEIAPPLSVSPHMINKKVGWLDEYIAAANFTDNASATPKMGSLASSKICLDSGLEPVMQIQARDRSRAVAESDAIGAAGLGIRISSA